MGSTRPTAICVKSMNVILCKLNDRFSCSENLQSFREVKVRLKYLIKMILRVMILKKQYML